MTNEEAKQQAEKIVNGVWHRRRANDDIASRYLTAMLIEDIALALAVPAGCVRDENLVDRKVLGELPVDKLGRVIGTTKRFHTIHRGEVIECGLFLMKLSDVQGRALAFEVDEDEDDADELHDLFDTREAASSALSSTEKGKANETA